MTKKIEPARHRALADWPELIGGNAGVEDSGYSDDQDDGLLYGADIDAIDNLEPPPWVCEVFDDLDKAEPPPYEEPCEPVWQDKEPPDLPYEEPTHAEPPEVYHEPSSSHADYDPSDHGGWSGGDGGWGDWF